MGRPRTVDRSAALEALWGRSSADAAQLVGCCPSILRRILQEQPEEVREAYHVARIAQELLRRSRDETVRALAETLLTVVELRTSEMRQGNDSDPVAG